MVHGNPGLLRAVCQALLLSSIARCNYIHNAPGQVSRDGQLALAIVHQRMSVSRGVQGFASPAKSQIPRSQANPLRQGPTRSCSDTYAAKELAQAPLGLTLNHITKMALLAKSGLKAVSARPAQRVRIADVCIS